MRCNCQRQLEEAVKLVKLVKIEHATDSCTVAFVPLVFASTPSVINNINKFA
jgi:hypothetical protein